MPGMNEGVLGAAVPAIGRLVISAIFLVSAIGKVAAPGATIAFVASAHLPLPQVASSACVPALARHFQEVQSLRIG
jgi:uncharacterized membrane protein YphA (DoxX/SURF4 family)